ncbi:MAG: hypothetical protein AVDCRST_MAG20-1857 [uncultured Acidimicrobiales bacterium]|uniref:Uncharacterized protein n=1 Tax=uncultured Acidimicrobiales bacterium TaxID=310071 RepID=A0A6J4I6A8_9ACTN|nr:MAG: hypothetical protein AVDCRST_MAG20-1857 [uncultured Acidimicrobiales bacterium]
MTPEELVTAASPDIGDLGWAFYFVPETGAMAEELGLDMFRFYFLGRGGVLGDVEATVVASAFGYFEPGLVSQMWESGKEVMSPREAGRAYHLASAEHGRRRLSGIEGLEAFCAAAERVNDAADPVALPLYAGIRSEPLVDDLPGRSMQLLTVLRELRGSAHLLAVRAVGLDAKTAHWITRPGDIAMFGWSEDDAPPVTDEVRSLRAEAEALTDRLVLPAFAVLDDPGQQDLLTGLERIGAALRA